MEKQTKEAMEAIEKLLNAACKAQRFTTEGKIGDAFSSGRGPKGNEHMSKNIGKVGGTVDMKGGLLVVGRDIGDFIYMPGEHKEDEHKEGHVDRIKDKTHAKGGHEHKEGHDGEKKKEKKKEHGHEHNGHRSSRDSYSG